jgi:nucleotide-binding universal stress UspA family protein
MVAGVGPVVVGTDFSDTAGVALVEARRLALLLGADVQVVHVIDGAPGSPTDSPELADRWLSAAGVRRESLTVRFGSAWVELARYASEVSPTLVVVGSHGRSGYQPLTLGGTAARVSVHARCPVVVVSPRVASLSLDAGLQDRMTIPVSRAGAVAGARDVPGDP